MDLNAGTVKRLLMKMMDEKRSKEIQVNVHSPRGFQLLGIQRSCRTGSKSLLLPVMLLRAPESQRERLRAADKFNNCIAAAVHKHAANRGLRYVKERKRRWKGAAPTTPDKPDVASCPVAEMAAVVFRGNKKLSRLQER